MAGAREYMFFWPIKCWTGGVRAETAEREEHSLRRMQEKAWMLVMGVGNDLHTANGDIPHKGYHFDRVGILSSAGKDD